jgi:type IV pilus assembly protein PilB
LLPIPGRMALFEMMPVTETLAEMISKHRNAAELRNQAIEEGMRTLRQNGFIKVIEGLTMPEEVLRETGGGTEVPKMTKVS